MPNVLRSFKKPEAAPIPEPLNQQRGIRSEVKHSFEPKTPVSWVGQPPISNHLPITIMVSLSHAF